ncbi:hypothetical protein D3C84_729960 [compost metagenome]
MWRNAWASRSMSSSVRGMVMGCSRAPSATCSAAAVRERSGAVMEWESQRENRISSSREPAPSSMTRVSSWRMGR